jgi:nanoRNase/pAp phosphatase (c-di-AMP/oligoRNAs hydrolase)
MIDVIIGHGTTVLAYQEQQNTKLMHAAFVHEWKGIAFLAVNAGGINSKAFESRYDSTLHGAVLSFYFHGEQRKWTVSLYSPDQSRDLSGIAKSMGGGGHAAACGFQVERLSDIGL